MHRSECSGHKLQLPENLRTGTNHHNDDINNDEYNKVGTGFCGSNAWWQLVDGGCTSGSGSNQGVARSSSKSLLQKVLAAVLQGGASVCSESTIKKSTSKGCGTWLLVLSCGASCSRIVVAGPVTFSLSLRVVARSFAGWIWSLSSQWCLA